MADTNLLTENRSFITIDEAYFSWIMLRLEKVKHLLKHFCQM